MTLISVGFGTATTTTVVGTPGPTGDDTEAYIPALYGNYPFTVDVQFSKADTSNLSYTVTNVQYTANTPFITTSKPNASTIRMVKSANPFTDTRYDYRMANNAIQTYTVDEIGLIPFDEIAGMFEWHYPDPKYILVNHTFTITSLGNNGVYYTDTATLPQYFYWKLEPDLAQFISLIEQETL